MRLHLLALTVLVTPCWAADLVGGGLRVLGVREVDDARALITVQGDPGAETYMVDCIGATWGFAGAALQPIKPNQRSQAVAERACRGLEFKAELVSQAGTWASPVIKGVQGQPHELPAVANNQAPTDSIYSDYTPEQYPRIFAKWGADGVEYLRFMERLSVSQVEASSACDRADYVGLSEGRSAPPKDAVMFVDCLNGNRFYIGAAELLKRPDELEFKSTR